MLTKRLFDPADPKPGPGRVKILRLGERQKFTIDGIAKGVMAGYMTMARGRIVIHAANGDVVFRIRRTPGLWCCHCGGALNDQVQARRHVIDSHPGLASPDRNNPAGYEHLSAFEGERE